jgi:hypothetical protein
MLEYCSIQLTLSESISDFGHVIVNTLLLAQTGGALSGVRMASHPHRRFSSRPALRHASHFQPPVFDK